MSWFLLFVMNSVVVLIAVLFLVRRIERRIQPTVILEQIRSEIDELMVEFNQTTERNVVLIEERILRMNKLLEEADRRATVLRRDIDAHQGPVRAYASPMVPKPIAPSPTSAKPPIRAVDNLPTRSTGEPETPAGATTDTPVVDASAAVPSKPAVAAGDKRARIVDLYEKGIAPNIIAARVGSTVGEVELIVSLTQRER